MNSSARELKLIQLTRKAFPNEEVSNQYKFKNTTIKQLAEGGGGGYDRMVKWLEGVIAKMPKEEVIPEEMLAMKQYYRQAYDLLISRNQKYGDSWKVLSIQSAANLIEMKTHRIANMTSKELDPKIEDELVDSINYAVMALYKFNQTKNDSH